MADLLFVDTVDCTEYICCL